MHAAPAQTVSFFEYATSDKSSRRTGAFLDRMEALIPWTEIAGELTPALYDGQTGRPGFPVTVLVKALLLEAWFTLSDPELEEQVLDRLSFQRFLGVSDRKDIPDETTVCRFRTKLVDIGAMENLFTLVRALIEREGGRYVRARSWMRRSSRPRGDGSGGMAPPRGIPMRGSRRRTGSGAMGTRCTRRRIRADGSSGRSS